ncbi:MAG: peptidyl-prolyl cis-trans isomerase [Anaerotignum sp.]|nr:peptidyl-prolyl cis-trans isomerase [Anaerotignum sp.]
MKKKGLLCLLIAGAMALSACGSDNASNSDNASGSDFSDEVVMKIDDREIMKSEYMVYLYTTTKSFTSVGGDDIWTTDFDGQTADELVEERTLKTLQSVIAAKKYAEENNIAITDDQKTEVATASEQFVSSVPAEDIAKMGIDAGSLAPYMEGSYIYSLVYQALVSECEVDEAEKAKYYEENKDQMKEEMITVELDSIVLNDSEKANEVAEKAKSGTDFISLFQEYDIDETARLKEDGGKMTVYKTPFLSTFQLTEIPEIGVVTGPIDVDGTYFILRVTSVTTPEEAEVKTAAENTFTTQKQTEYSDARFEEMIAGQKVEYMDEAYKNLEKFH